MITSEQALALSLVNAGKGLEDILREVSCHIEDAALLGERECWVSFAKRVYPSVSYGDVIAHLSGYVVGDESDSNEVVIKIEF